MSVNKKYRDFIKLVMFISKREIFIIGSNFLEGYKNIRYIK